MYQGIAKDYSGRSRTCLVMGYCRACGVDGTPFHTVDGSVESETVLSD